MRLPRQPTASQSLLIGCSGWSPPRLQASAAIGAAFGRAMLPRSAMEGMRVSLRTSR